MRYLNILNTPNTCHLYEIITDAKHRKTFTESIAQSRQGREVFQGSLPNVISRQKHPRPTVCMCTKIRLQMNQMAKANENINGALRLNLTNCSSSL